MKNELLQSPAEVPFIPTMSNPERRAFNLLFSKLYGEKDVDLKTARRWLSGIRVGQGGHKAAKGQIKAWLSHWHRMSLIVMIHGQVRLGSLELFLSVLDYKNTAIVQRQVGARAQYSLNQAISFGRSLGHIETDLREVGLSEHFRGVYS